MNPADLTLNLSTSLSKPLPAPLSATQRHGKTPVPRVDLEPVYTQLKGALGDQWVEYKAAVNAFVLGMCCRRRGEWCMVGLANGANDQVI